MAAALKKNTDTTIDTEAPSPQTVGDLSGAQKPEVVETTIDGIASPARQLQDKLDAHFMPVSRKMSARYVTVLVGLTCLGTWISGVGLYATL